MEATRGELLSVALMIVPIAFSLIVIIVAVADRHKFFARKTQLAFFIAFWSILACVLAFAVWVVIVIVLSGSMEYSWLSEIVKIKFSV